jgi:hypothetical protein
LLFLSSVFSIGICAYAVMSNHTHVVLCVDKDLAENWSPEEVIRRWHKLYQGTLLSQKYQRGDKLSKGESISLNETVTIYRQRSYDISWLMRNLNEYEPIGVRTKSTRLSLSKKIQRQLIIVETKHHAQDLNRQ